MNMTGAGLVEELRKHQVLDEEQLARVDAELHPQHSDAKALAAEMCRRDLLTYYQAEQLLAGRAAELVLGKYRLLDRLGSGGMGQVFRAYHRILQSVRAVKIIHPDCLTSREAIQRFFREARAVAALKHPNIVVAHDADQEGDRCYFVMEYVPGIDLAHLVKERGALPVGEACDYARQAALGLQHAHDKGMVHRDIKPGNILLSREDGVVKILDLGLARLRDPGASALAGEVPLTAQGMMMGTPDFMAPEQAEDSGGVDIRADVYSLGCTLYQLLSGSVPFPGGSLGEKLRKHYAEMPAPLTQRRPEVPPALSAVVERMMAKRPDQRYQTPGEVAEALRLYCAADGAPSIPQTQARQHTEDSQTAPFPFPRTMEFPTDEGADERPTRGSVTEMMTGDVFSLPPTDAAEGTPRRGRPARPAAPAGPGRKRLAIGLAFAGVLLVPPVLWWALSREPDEAPQPPGPAAHGPPGKDDPTKEQRERKEKQGNGDVRPGPGPAPKDNGTKPGPAKDGAVKPPPNPKPKRWAVGRGLGKSAGGEIVLDKPVGSGGEPLAKARTWERRNEVLATFDPEVPYVVLSPDGSRAAARGGEHIELHATVGKREIIDLKTSGIGDRTTRLGTAIGELALAPGGTQVVFATTATTSSPVRGKPNIIKEYDVLVAWRGPQPRFYFGETAGVIGDQAVPLTRCLAVSPDGKSLLVGTRGEQAARFLLRRWDLASAKPHNDRPLAETPIADAPTCAALAPDSRHAVVGLAGSSPALYRLAPDRDEPVGELKGHGNSVRCVAFVGERTIVAGDSDGTVCAWQLPEQPKGDIAALHAPQQWHTKEKAVLCVAASPKGLVATGGADGAICVGKVGEGPPLWTEKLGSEVRAVAFAPDGLSVVYATRKGLGRIHLAGTEALPRPAPDSSPEIKAKKGEDALAAGR